jgi:hypothetical protein
VQIPDLLNGLSLCLFPGQSTCLFFFLEAGEDVPCRSCQLPDHGSLLLEDRFFEGGQNEGKDRQEKEEQGEEDRKDGLKGK